MKRFPISNYIIILNLFLISCSGEGSLIWDKNIGSSVFEGVFDSTEKKKEEKVEPLITYGALKNNISSDLTDGFSNPINKIPVGEKVVDGFTSFIPSVPMEPLITGDAKTIYDNAQGPFPPNVSGLIPDGGDSLVQPLPNLPFSDLNKNPIVLNPFFALDSVPQAPPTEFFFDEISYKPPVLS